VTWLVINTKTNHSLKSKESDFFKSTQKIIWLDLKIGTIPFEYFFFNKSINYSQRRLYKKIHKGQIGFPIVFFQIGYRCLLNMERCNCFPERIVECKIKKSGNEIIYSCFIWLSINMENKHPSKSCNTYNKLPDPLVSVQDEQHGPGRSYRKKYQL